MSGNAHVRVGSLQRGYNEAQQEKWVCVCVCESKFQSLRGMVLLRLNAERWAPKTLSNQNRRHSQKSKGDSDIFAQQRVKDSSNRITVAPKTRNRALFAKFEDQVVGLNGVCDAQNLSNYRHFQLTPVYHEGLRHLILFFEHREARSMVNDKHAAFLKDPWHWSFDSNVPGMLCPSYQIRREWLTNDSGLTSCLFPASEDRRGSSKAD